VTIRMHDPQKYRLRIRGAAVAYTDYLRVVLTLVRRIGVWLCGSIGLLFLFVTFTPFVSWYGGKLAGQWTDPDGDTLIVLAGGDLDNGFPSNSTLWRCLYALRACQTGHFRKIVTVGFQTSRYMADLLAWEGIPAGMIVTETASRSTRENALYTAKLLAGDTGSKVLLTSDYHMFRAARAFRKAGLNFSPRPIPDAGKRGVRPLERWSVFLDEAVETVKICYYFLCGWI
jgi:uncharacterized SAM-binding protein YcdF (DUF218 family)